MHLIAESKDAAERADALKCVNDGLAGPFGKYAAENTLILVLFSVIDFRGIYIFVE